jgi:hypothetical protein
MENKAMDDLLINKAVVGCNWDLHQKKQFIEDYYRKRLEFAKKKANNEKAGPEVKDAKKKANAYKSRKDRVSLID